MTLLRSLVIAISCFSQIPMPHVKWEAESMRFMMAFFPVVGVVIALLWALWAWAVGQFGFGGILAAAGLTLIPVLVTGGIHLDGFADTCDALASNAPPEKRREILKDPNAGAFAVIGMVSYMLAYFALATEINLSASLVQLCVIPVLVRSLSGIATVTFPSSSKEGMLASFHDAAESIVVLFTLVVLVLACVAVVMVLDLASGMIMFVVALVCLFGVYRMATRTFGGMSGDLAGFFLQICELALVACVAFLG